ncbi:MAG: hypothetical protein IJS41_05140, partial [Clostridia bacterium]|nr:hypothetical protein [Clostridia bacterium]
RSGSDEVFPKLVIRKVVFVKANQGVHLISQARISLISSSSLVPRLTASPARGSLLAVFLIRFGKDYLDNLLSPLS